MRPKYSIITVVKNDKNRIIKTINSVLNQNFKNFEYIVIDGKSSDGTINIIRNLKRNNKFKFYSRKDISFYDSLNFGVKNCTGKFIGILNSGDIFVNTNVLNKIDQKIFNSTKVFYGNISFIKKNKKIREWKHKLKKITKFNLFKIPHSTLFIDKDLYKKIGYYDLNYKISSDLDFLIKLSKKNDKINYLNYDTIFMEYGGLSTNIKYFRKKIYEDFKILIKHYGIKFLFYYFLKIYFKFNDFHFINIIKLKK